VSVAVRRRRVALLVVGALVVVVLIAFVAQRVFGGDEPPATGAAALAPKDTLIYTHVSTDEGRGAVERATDLLERFDAYDGARDALLQRLVGTPGKVTAKDVEPWLGDEAALALVDAGQATAGSLVIVEVTDEDRAREFLAKNPRR
jgi:hypothetical protein